MYLFFNHLRIVFRLLLQNRAYTLINVLGLGIGMTGAIVIFYTLRHETGFDRFHSNSENIYRVVQHNHTSEGTQYWNTTAYTLPTALRNDFPDLEVTQTAGPFSRVIHSEDPAQNIIRYEEDKVLFVDQHYLKMFDFKHIYNSIWLQGHPDKALENPNSVVITQDIASRYFPEDMKNKASVLGKTLILDNREPLTVTGLIRTPPTNTNLLFELLIPYAHFQKENPYATSNWSGNYGGTTYLALQKTANPKEIEQKIAKWKNNYLKPEDHQRIEYRLQPLADLHINALYGNSEGSYVIARETLWGLAFMGLFLILIGCVNYINLATAQISRRNIEVGVRKVLGGSRHQLIRQFMAEILILTAASGLISILASDIILKQVSRSITLFDIDLQLDGQVILLYAALIVLTTLLAGSYPALALSAGSPISALKKEKVKFNRKGFNLRKSLIGFQFGIAHLLILGTIIVATQMHYLRNKDLGFYKDTILTVNIPMRDSAKLQTFAQRLKQNPHIQEISYASGIPLTHSDDTYGTDFRLSQEPISKIRAAEMKVVDLQYKEVFDLEMVAGKWLNQANKSNFFNAFIANESAVKLLGLSPEEAIGQQLIINEGKAPIIGVVKDFHNNPLQEAVNPCLLFYWGTGFFGQANIKLSPAQGIESNLSETLGFIEQTWKTSFPDGIYEYAFLDEQLAKNYAIEDLIFKAFQAVAFLAIFIGCIGLYGVISFISEIRTKEIGVRKVLGASLVSIVLLLGKDFIRPILLALVCATPVAWYLMNRWLEDFYYRIEIQWWVFVGAAILAIVIAVLTVSWRSVQAARVNPVESLRNE